MRLNTILVLLHQSNPMELLKMASDLAYHAGAELTALYVEDRDWYEASSFSFSQQISGYRGEILPLTERHITEQSRALSARFEKIFTSYTQALNIKYSYRVTQTHSSQELKEALTNVDLVLMGGNIPSSDFWIKNTAQHTTPLLIWNHPLGRPKEIIGFCITPEQSLAIVNWTLHLADWTNLKSRLFWKKEFSINKAWTDEIKKDSVQTVSNIIQRINNISQIQPALTADILQHYRNALFVARRQDLYTEPNTFNQKIPGSMLLL